MIREKGERDEVALDYLTSKDSFVGILKERLGGRQNGDQTIYMSTDLGNGKEDTEESCSDILGLVSYLDLLITKLTKLVAQFGGS